MLGPMLPKQLSKFIPIVGAAITAYELWDLWQSYNRQQRWAYGPGWQQLCSTGVSGEGQYAGNNYCGFGSFYAVGSGPAPYGGGDFIYECNGPIPVIGAVAYTTQQIWQRIDPAAEAPVELPEVMFFPQGTNVVPVEMRELPWEVIPYQKMFDNPQTERGYERAVPVTVEEARQFWWRVGGATFAGVATGQELNVRYPGRTWIWDIPAVGKPTASSYVPAAAGPASGPSAVSAAPPVGPLPKPPAKREKERKQRVRAADAFGGSIPVRVVTDAFGKATEACDAVEALFMAIPLKQRIKDKKTYYKPRALNKRKSDTKGHEFASKYGHTGCVQQAFYVYHNLDKIGWGQALAGLFMNEVKDRLIGSASSDASKAFANATKKARFAGGKGRSAGLTIGPAL